MGRSVRRQSAGGTGVEDEVVRDPGSAANTPFASPGEGRAGLDSVAGSGGRKGVSMTGASGSSGVPSSGALGGVSVLRGSASRGASVAGMTDAPSSDGIGTRSAPARFACPSRAGEGALESAAAMPCGCGTTRSPGVAGIVGGKALPATGKPLPPAGGNASPERSSAKAVIPGCSPVG